MGEGVKITELNITKRYHLFTRCTHAGYEEFVS